MEITKEQLEIRALKNLLERARSDFDNLKGEIEDLKASSRFDKDDRLATVQGLVEVLRPYIGEFPAEVRVLVPEAEALRRDNDVLRSKVKTLEAVVRDKDQMIERLKAIPKAAPSQETLKGRLAYAETQIARLRADEKRLNKEIDDLREQVAFLARARRVLEDRETRRLLKEEEKS